MGETSVVAYEPYPHADGLVPAGRVGVDAGSVLGAERVPSTTLFRLHLADGTSVVTDPAGRDAAIRRQG